MGTRATTSTGSGAESDAALDDFKKRVEAYEAQYEPLQAKPDPCGKLVDLVGIWGLEWKAHVISILLIYRCFMQ